MTYLKSNFSKLSYLNYSDKHLALFRILLSSFLILFGGYFRYHDFPDLPNVFLSYPSLATVYNQFPSLLFFNVIDVLLSFSLICVLIGFQSKLFSLLAFLFIVVNYSFAFSIGGASSLFLMPFYLLVLSFSNMDKYYSLDKIFNYRSIHPVRFSNFFVSLILLLTLTFSFFLSGFMKIKGGWLSSDSQAIFVYWIANYYYDYRTSIINPENLVIQNRWFWELADYIIVLIEITPFLFFWHKKVLQFSLWMLAVFQLLVYFLLNISFSIFPLMYCFFMISEQDINIINLLHNMLSKLWSRKYVKLGFIIAAIIFSVSVVYIFNADRSGWLKDFPTIQLVGLFASFLLCSYLCVLNLLNKIKVNHESNIKK